MIKLSKKLRIVCYSLLAVLVLVLAALVYANVVIDDLLQAEIAKLSQQYKAGRMQVGRVDVNLWTSSAALDDVYFAVDSIGKANAPAYTLSVKKAEIKYVRLLRMLLRKQLYVNTIEISDADVSLLLNDAPKNQQQEVGVGWQASQDLLRFIALLDVENVLLNNASIQVKSSSTPFQMQVDSAYVYAHNLRCNFADSTITYNDSLYRFSFRNLSFVEPAGEYKVSIGALDTENAQALLAKNVAVKCIVPKEKLAEKRGRVAATWMDAQIDSIKLSSLNVIRAIFQQSCSVDRVEVGARKLDMYRDSRYPMKKVSRPLQLSLMQLKKEIFIGRLVMSVNTFNYQFQGKQGGVGKLSLQRLMLTANRVSNKPSNMINCNIKGLMGNQAPLNMQLSLDLNNLCTWNCEAQLKNLKMDTFNEFVGPMMGVGLKGNIRSVEAKYAGDSLEAKGIFTMCYDSVKIKVLPTSPVPWLAKHARAVTDIANVLIPKSNPLHAKKDPKSYYLHTQRPMNKPYMFHLISPMIQGVKETLLGEFYLSKEVKSWRKKSNSWYEEYVEKRDQ